MTGAVAGVIRLDGAPADAGAVARMLGALAHRGDAASVWSAGPAALGRCARRAAAEAGSDAAAVIRRSTELVAIADARLDNREELGAALGLGLFGLPDDAELILLAYERWGESCVTRLIGDFAFAIWDAGRRTLWCARDPMGVRPLFYHRTSHVLVFASEVKALLCAPSVPCRLRAGCVQEFLLDSADDPLATAFDDIQRLPAAHAMSVSPVRVTRTRYWSPGDAPDVRLGSDGEYAEAFAVLLTEAVRSRMRAAGPVGTTLSGGLDSSSVTCIARAVAAEASPRELHTFSLVFPSLDAGARRLIDERPFIEAVTRGGGLRPHDVRGDELGPLTSLAEVLPYLGEPTSAPNLYLHCGMYAAAREAGVTVLLDGFDGDTTVGHGFGRLNSLMRAGHWAAFEAELRAFAERRRLSPGRVLQHYGLPYLSDRARHGSWRTWLRVARELRARFGVSRRELLVRHGLVPRAPSLVHAWRAVRGSHDLTAELARRPTQPGKRHGSGRRRDAVDDAPGDRTQHVRGLSAPLYQRTLETADTCAHVYGIEARYPFFDRRLIEFCVGVPEEQKLANGWTRLLLRRAMEGVLPREIQWRVDKGNLSPNFHRGLRTVDRGRVERACAPDGPLAPWIEPAALRALAERYFGERDLEREAPDGHTLFRAAALAMWLEASRGAGGGRVEPTDVNADRGRRTPAEASTSGASNRVPTRARGPQTAVPPVLARH